MITVEYIKSALSKGKFQIVPLNLEVFEAIRALTKEEADEITSASNTKIVADLKAKRDKMNAEIQEAESKLKPKSEVVVNE